MFLHRLDSNIKVYMFYLKFITYPKEKNTSSI